jgi:L,D-peptidoglycan transpeptidase YkuD (ErfK/YbiS/YcfS/YnhG family)
VLTQIRRFGRRPSTSQIIVAHVGDFATSFATVATFERVDGTWRRAFHPMAAGFGVNGSVPGEQRVQGSNQTPAGVYTIPSGFGRLDSPGGVVVKRFAGGTLTSDAANGAVTRS